MSSDHAKALEEKKRRLAELRKQNEERKGHLHDHSGGAKSVDAILSELSHSTLPHVEDTPSSHHDSHVSDHYSSPMPSVSHSSSGFDLSVRRERLAAHILNSIDVKPKVTETYEKSSGTQLEIPPDRDITKLIDAMYDTEPETPAQATAAPPSPAEDKSRRMSAGATPTQPEEEEPRITELTPAERKAVLSSDDFSDFFSKTTRMVERALAIREKGIDVAVDYSQADRGTAISGEDDSVLSELCKFYDERKCKHRPLTAVDWSPKHPELVLGAYYSRTLEAASPDADGVVLLWSTVLQNRPEYSFSCQSAVTSAQFCKFSPHLVVGGTYSGQIVLWDTREKSAPVQRTALSSSGHSHPVYCMDIVGSQNAHSLISISTDGRMCVWKLGMLSRPQETVELRAPSTAGSRPSRETGSSVSTTALSFPDGEVNTFFIGAENGSIYSANRHGSQVGISDGMQYDSHFGPVTSLHFHPSTGPTDFGDLFLSCSVDWTMRLNSTRQSKPLTTFETATDYMYDVNWSPTHPALFCSADGSGKLDLWNLCESTETPAVRTKASERALSRCTWSNNGRQIATGDSGGTLTIWNVSPDTADSRNEDWEKMHEVLKGNFSYGSSAADMEDVSGAEAEAPVEA